MADVLNQGAHSTLVESLKRLYRAEKVSVAELSDLVTKGKITQEDYDYIVEEVEEETEE